MQSTYRYTLADFHAIKSADITLAGITVLAGENGCGKSTLSRWLYYLVNGVNGFDYFVETSLKNGVYNIVVRLDEVRAEIFRNITQLNDEATALTAHLLSHDIADLKEQLHPTVGEGDIAGLFSALVSKIGDLLTVFLNTVPEGPQRDRVVKYLLQAADTGETTEQLVDNFKSLYRAKFTKLAEDRDLQTGGRPLPTLLKAIKQKYKERDEAPQHLQLYEDGVSLLNADTVSVLFNLRRAVYVDTPMALSEKGSDNVFWKVLNDSIMGDSVELQRPQKLILQRIHNIVQGRAVVVKDPLSLREPELRFISDDGRVDIKMEKAATGFKTFSYLQRLVECGTLDSETLLLIDEPEAHLHPQWVVEYANLLVLLHKELGVKIMMATHNPDMVAAVQTVANNRGVLQNTRFYIAEIDEQSQKYAYNDTGTEICDIFKSFNSAYSVMEMYGDSSIRQ